MDKLRNSVGAAFVCAAQDLDRERLAAVPAILDEERERVERIRAQLHAQAPISELEEPLRVLLARLRATSVKGKLSALRWIDRWFHSERLELIDLEGTPEWFKGLEIKNLDLQNRWFGNYEGFLSELRRVAPSGPLRLHDLASGSGGFFQFIAERKLAPADWDLCVSDLLEGSLEQGRARAEQKGLPVRFERRDATDLGDLRGDVDLFTLQSAAHHLSPGVLISVMHTAASVAPGGLLIIDPTRSLGSAALVLLACVASVVTLPNVYDAVLSVRRAYSAAELVLLARVAELSAEPRYVPPIFTRVLVRREAHAPGCLLAPRC